MTHAITLHEVAGEPFVRDTELAERLGYAEPRQIRRLINKHMPALEKLNGNKAVPQWYGVNPGNGEPVPGYLLARKLALYVVTKSDAEKAAEITVIVVEVFDAWLSGKLVPPPQFPIPKTLPEALRLAADQMERAEARVAALAPKAEAYIDHVKSDGFTSVAEAAKCLGIGEHKAFAALRTMTWLDRRPDRGHIPREWVLRRGWMVVRPVDTPVGRRMQPLFTMAGVEAFYEAYRKSELFTHDVDPARLLPPAKA